MSQLKDDRAARLKIDREGMRGVRSEGESKMEVEDDSMLVGRSVGGVLVSEELDPPALPDPLDKIVIYISRVAAVLRTEEHADLSQKMFHIAREFMMVGRELDVRRGLKVSNERRVSFSSGFALLVWALSHEPTPVPIKKFLELAKQVGYSESTLGNPSIVRTMAQRLQDRAGFKVEWQTRKHGGNREVVYPVLFWPKEAA